MSELQDKLLEVVQDSLGVMEVASIKKLIEDNERIPALERTLQESDSRREQLGAQASGYRKNNELLKTENESLKNKLGEAQDKMTEMSRKQAIFDYLMDDRNKLFDIMGSAYKHYTHTTTRQISLRPNFEGDQSHMDHSKYPPVPHKDELVERSAVE